MIPYMIPYMLGKLAPNSTHSIKGFVEYIPGRDFFRVVLLQNGNKMRHPTHSLNDSLIEHTIAQLHSIYLTVSDGTGRRVDFGNIYPGSTCKPGDKLRLSFSFGVVWKWKQQGRQGGKIFCYSSSSTARPVQRLRGGGDVTYLSPF